MKMSHCYQIETQNHAIESQDNIDIPTMITEA